MIEGTVIRGLNTSCVWGFPTANIRRPKTEEYLRIGTHRCEVYLGEEMLGLGLLFHTPYESFRDVYEVYIQGYDGNLYGKDITIVNIDWQSPSQLKSLLDAGIGATYVSGKG